MIHLHLMRSSSIRVLWLFFYSMFCDHPCWLRFCQLFFALHLEHFFFTICLLLRLSIVLWFFICSRDSAIVSNLWFCGRCSWFRQLFPTFSFSWFYDRFWFNVMWSFFIQCYVIVLANCSLINCSLLHISCIVPHNLLVALVKFQFPWLLLHRRFQLQ